MGTRIRRSSRCTPILYALEGRLLLSGFGGQHASGQSRWAEFGTIDGGDRDRDSSPDRSVRDGSGYFSFGDRSSVAAVSAGGATRGQATAGLTESSAVAGSRGVRPPSVDTVVASVTAWPTPTAAGDRGEFGATGAGTLSLVVVPTASSLVDPRALAIPGQVAPGIGVADRAIPVLDEARAVFSPPARGFATSPRTPEETPPDALAPRAADLITEPTTLDRVSLETSLFRLLDRIGFGEALEGRPNHIATLVALLAGLLAVEAVIRWRLRLVTEAAPSAGARPPMTHTFSDSPHRFVSSKGLL